MKRKILLINPPIKNSITTELPEFISSEAGVFPPLGLMYVAVQVREHFPECTVYILDAVALSLDIEEIDRFAVQFEPDIVAITAHLHNLPDIQQLVGMLKASNPDSYLCVGGPAPTIFPEKISVFKGVDVVVIGEGEETFVELINCLIHGGALGEVKGVSFNKDGQSMRIPARSVAGKLDQYPFPERKSLPYKQYCYALSRQGGLFTTMISSRGCPFQCSFCSTPHTPYRVRSVGNIMQEIEGCLSMGITDIHFVDDTFGLLPGFIDSFCEEISRRDLIFRWSIRARVDTLTREMIENLKRCGCSRIQFGVETATDEGLGLLRKDVTIEQIRKSFRWANEAGMETVAYFLLGCPHEKTPQDLQRTIDFALELNPSFAMFNLLILYPGTELFDRAVAQGLVDQKVWERFVAAPKQHFALPCWEEHFSRQALMAWVVKAYRAFYLRPGVMWRAVKRSRSLGAIAKNVMRGAKIFAAQK